MPTAKTLDIEAYHEAMKKLMHELPTMHAPEAEWTRPVKTVKDIKALLPRVRSAIQRNTVFATQTRLMFDELHALVKATLTAIKAEKKETSP